MEHYHKGNLQCPQHCISCKNFLHMLNDEVCAICEGKLQNTPNRKINFKYNHPHFYAINQIFNFYWKKALYVKIDSLAMYNYQHEIYHGYSPDENYWFYCRYQNIIPNPLIKGPKEKELDIPNPYIEPFRNIFNWDMSDRSQAHIIRTNFQTDKTPYDPMEIDIGEKLANFYHYNTNEMITFILAFEEQEACYIRYNNKLLINNGILRKRQIQ